MDKIPWAKWPWNRCPARFSILHHSRRCDLKRHKDGFHRAEEGMHDLIWSDNVEAVAPGG